MTAIRPLDLGSVDELGVRARRCVYWQTDDRPAGEFAGDPEFEKEAWISRVALEWGVCGQVAVEGSRAVGAAFYAPPGMVPRADCFPTSPVGPDAILLAGLGVESGAPAGVLTSLLDAVVEDLRARGIKAIETFGTTSETETDPSGATDTVPSRDGCGAESCVAASGFLVEHGFSVVAPHERYPRLRLDIESDHLWKADVERALDQLFAERGFPTRRIGALAGVVSRAAVVRSR